MADILRIKFRQSQDYKYEMLIRDLIEQAEELNKIIANQQAQIDDLIARVTDLETP